MHWLGAGSPNLELRRPISIGLLGLLDLALPDVQQIELEHQRGVTARTANGVVRARFPAVGEALDWLARHAPARLTGTGSCVFAKFGAASDAERVAARVPDTWRAYVARGLDESPLLEQLGRWGVAKW